MSLPRGMFVYLQSITFTRLEEALHFDWTTEQGKKKVKKTPVCYFIIQGKWFLKLSTVMGRTLFSLCCLVSLNSVLS